MTDFVAQRLLCASCTLLIFCNKIDPKVEVTPTWSSNQAMGLIVYWEEGVGSRTSSRIFARS
jgi:hypothetical protein